VESIEFADRARHNTQGKLGEAGMTLPEVALVMAIIMLAAMLAVPNYNSWSAKYKLKQGTTELHSSLNLTRMAAMNRNMTMTATPALVGGRVTVTFTDPSSTSADCLGNPGRCVLPTQVMPREVTNVAGAAQIRYNSMGLLTGVGTATQTITLTNSFGLVYEVQVTPGGKARSCPTVCS
jgi:type IV fimbrial biogenesis protein FimT